MHPAILAWAEADRRLDLEAMREQLAEDVQLDSPLTDAFTFTGPDQVMAVMESAFELLEQIEIHKVTGAARTYALSGTSRLRGRNLEEIQWLELSPTGRIQKITLFIRPVPAAVSLLALIGPELARRDVLTRRATVASRAAAPIASVLRAVETSVMPRLRRPGVTGGPHRTD